MVLSMGGLSCDARTGRSCRRTQRRVNSRDDVVLGGASPRNRRGLLVLQGLANAARGEVAMESREQGLRLQVQRRAECALCDIELFPEHAIRDHDGPAARALEPLPLEQRLL